MKLTTFRARNVDAYQLLYTLTCFELRYLRYFGLHVMLLRLFHVELVHIAALVDSTNLGSERLVRHPLGGLAG
jgi:hypothetical protein